MYIQGVPTNIVTGFLGVGKTSAILHLLEQKPSNERWAVLVNEFGEIGVDGSVFGGCHTENHSVFVREVPGGCMCCTAGLPMQIALNQLLTRARPHRLLIEPTGLGHPIEVLQTLSAAHYRDVLSIQKIITLVDARKLVDPRYTDHDTFNQQIAIADIIVGNKKDLYDEADRARLVSYARDKGMNVGEVVFTQQGKIDLSKLEGATATISESLHDHHQPLAADNVVDVPIPECGYIKAINRGEGFQSIGWRFHPAKVFDRARLFSFLSGLEVERLKGVFITESGVFAYNFSGDTLAEVELDDCLESRVEIIATHLSEMWESQLLACVDANG